MRNPFLSWNQFLSSNVETAGRFLLTRRALALLVAVLSLAGGTVNATTVTVHVSNFKFTNALITIQAGDTVEWIWDDSGHSSTSGTPNNPDGLWDSGILN